MRIAVVIPTFNRPGLLSEALRSVAAQTYPAERIEVVVVDNASDPALTAGQLPSQAPCARLIRLDEPRSLAAVRQLGAAEACEPDVIVHLDDDDLLAEDAIARVVSALEDHRGVDLMFLGARGFGSYANDFTRSHEEGVDKIIEWSKASRRELTEFEPALLFEALLRRVPMHFQRFAARPSAWKRVNEFRDRVYGLESAPSRDWKHYLTGPWRDSEFALYAALLCRTALIDPPVYRQRCERQGYVSLMDRRQHHVEAHVRIKSALFDASNRIPELAPHRSTIRRNLERIHLGHAYYAFNHGSRRAAWRELGRAVRVRPRLRHVRFAIRTLLPRAT